MGAAVRQFQISEEDLATLERLVPDVLQRLTMRPDATPQDRSNYRQIRDILVNVRWKYGPPEQVTRIEGGDEQQ